MEYLEDTLSAAAVNAFTQGAAATDQTLAVPTRNVSIVQNFQKHYQVANTQLAVTHAGMASMLSYQEVKRMKELKTDIELACHRGSMVSGASDTAAQMAGFMNKLSTNYTSSSGTTLTEDVLNDIVTLAYNAPVNLREFYSNMLLKRTINKYSSSVQRFLPAGERRQVEVIDVYESEMGILSAIKSRYQLQGTGKNTSGNSWMALDPDYFSIGWLRPIQIKVLGLDGDRERRFMVGECTVIYRSEKAGVGGTGYVPYFP